jgi:hypothetical protein
LSRQSITLPPPHEAVTKMDESGGGSVGPHEDRVGRTSDGLVSYRQRNEPGV